MERSDRQAGVGDVEMIEIDDFTFYVIMGVMLCYPIGVAVMNYVNYMRGKNDRP